MLAIRVFLEKLGQLWTSNVYSPPFFLTKSKYRNVYICNVSEYGLPMKFTAIHFWAYHRETIKYSCVWSPCMNNLWQLLSDNVNLFSPAAFPNNGECCSRCCGQPRLVEEVFASLWSLLLTGAHLPLLDIFYHSWWFSSLTNIFIPQSQARGTHCIPASPISQSETDNATKLSVLTYLQGTPSNST